jgi:hypothetical protein
MRTMKRMYMLRGVKTGRYMLESKDGCWLPLRLGSSEDLTSENPMSFVCNKDKAKMEAMAGAWNSLKPSEGIEEVEVVEVLRGFALPQPRKDAPSIPVKNDLVRRRDIYNLLFGIGGSGACPGTWDSGWDQATDEAIQLVINAPSATEVPLKTNRKRRKKK